MIYINFSSAITWIYIICLDICSPHYKHTPHCLLFSILQMNHSWIKLLLMLTQHFLPLQLVVSSLNHNPHQAVNYCQRTDTPHRQEMVFFLFSSHPTAQQTGPAGLQCELTDRSDPDTSDEVNTGDWRRHDGNTSWINLNKSSSLIMKYEI